MELVIGRSKKSMPSETHTRRRRRVMSSPALRDATRRSSALLSESEMEKEMLPVEAPMAAVPVLHQVSSVRVR